ncbi:MAG: YbaK/EbsC family protein [Bacteroidota bacterium]|nr:YbaK/EbsC family protein [Bacteroidota bacterium]MDP4204906.1 YbaK/EbsC family protein [Bacteroidota bacterium]
MPVKKLKDYLDSHYIEYITIRHSAAYTAQKIAACSHISGKEIAKTVMVKIDGNMAMVVLPAPSKVNFNVLKDVANAERIELATEAEFRDLFPECEIGAMPPFGNLYGIDVYVAESLTKDEAIAFNAGSHRELIQLAYKDYERLVLPKIVKI